MISGQRLLELVRSSFAGAATRHVFPFLRIRIVDVMFHGLEYEEREVVLCRKLNIDIGELRKTSDRLFLRFELLESEDETPVLLTGPGATWLGTFADEAKSAVATPVHKCVHFYGFKGGQGRTTMLAFLASELARDGQQVLVVDLDAEAPSLDVILSVGTIQPEASLVGLRAGLEISPLTVSAQRGGGCVALLAFRPTEREYDLDATALAFEAAIHAPSHASLAKSLTSVLEKFDVVLFDHRTGLGPTVPCWVTVLPGPVVIFDRLDGQSSRAPRHIGRIWRDLDPSGVIVSYTPPAMSSSTFREQHRGDAWPWLVALAEAKSVHAESDVEPDSIDDHWLLWPDDSAFRRRGVPMRDEVSGVTRECVARFREILSLAERKTQKQDPQQLHPSGATDQGLFIATKALRDLCSPGSPIRFIFGRKGTGKTRLLNELVRRSVGEPLVVAEDEKVGGLPSNSIDLKQLLENAERAGDLDGFWWALIAAAMRLPVTEPERLLALLSPGNSVTGVNVRQLAREATRSRVFLIDGLETMTRNREKTRDLIQALVRVWSSLEQDAVLRSRVSLRIFLRSDIARWGFENFEQQSFGKSTELSWSAQTIFNFVLSRLPHLQWIAKTFPETVAFVERHAADVEDGAIDESTALSQLLSIFPSKLGRLNLNTSTFLRTYFSDDPGGEVSYYPRVYYTFLEKIDSAALPLQKGRIGQDLILDAHDAASEAFLEQVRQELRFLTTMSDRDMDRLLNALKGRGTPFVFRDLRREIRNSLKLPMDEIDAAFNAMKEIGMFEQHPKSAVEWRVGRLFKSALKMKYRRE